ncbi:MAG: EthD family reductase, partial [Actinobacteria bacterium]|nr:EthD family reductase [Actinomycetota bacterium]
MIRYVVVLRRRADLTREQFLHVWLTEHLPMARA